MVAARHTAMDRRATATPTAAAHRTLPDRARPTIAPTARARHTTTAEVRLTRTPTGVKLRVNTAKGRPTRTPTAGPRPARMDRARLIPTFTAEPPLAPTARARTTPALMATALRIIHLPPIMAIIHLPRSTTTDQHAPTAVAGQQRRLSRRPMPMLPMLMQMLRPHRPTPTTPDTTPAQPLAAAQHLRPPMPWARSSGNYLRVASLPQFRARPTICVAIPGLARPTARMAPTTGWQPVPEVEQEITELTEIKFCWLLLNLSCSCMH